MGKTRLDPSLNPEMKLPYSNNYLQPDKTYIRGSDGTKSINDDTIGNRYYGHAPNKAEVVPADSEKGIVSFRDIEFILGASVDELLAKFQEWNDWQQAQAIVLLQEFRPTTWGILEEGFPKSIPQPNLEPAFAHISKLDAMLNERKFVPSSSSDTPDSRERAILQFALLDFLSNTSGGVTCFNTNASYYGGYIVVHGRVQIVGGTDGQWFFTLNKSKPLNLTILLNKEYE